MALHLHSLALPLTYTFINLRKYSFKNLNDIKTYLNWSNVYLCRYLDELDQASHV